MDLAWYLDVIGLEGAALVVLLAVALALVVLVHWLAEKDRCALRAEQRARLERGLSLHSKSSCETYSTGELAIFLRKT